MSEEVFESGNIRADLFYGSSIRIKSDNFTLNIDGVFHDRQNLVDFYKDEYSIIFHEDNKTTISFYIIEDNCEISLLVDEKIIFSIEIPEIEDIKEIFKSIVWYGDYHNTW